MRLGLRFSSAAPLVAASAFLLAGCGGGGGSGGGTSQGTAAVKGVLLTVDGSTSSLGGVQITNPRTGVTATTASNGTFDLGNLPAGTITLRLAGGIPGMVLRQDGGGDAGGSGGTDGVGDGPNDDLNDDSGSGSTDSTPNGDGDNDDVGDDDFDVTGVQNGESIEVRMAVANGTIQSLEVSRSGHDDRESEVNLHRSVDSDDPDVTGEAETLSRADRQRIRVKAEHVTPGRTLEWFTITPDTLSTESEGTATADLDGQARWLVDTSTGGTLPFGVATVADLDGYGIEIRDATSGVVLLVGTFGSTPDHEGDTGSTETRGGAALTPGTGVAGEAHVAVESKPSETREEFKVEVQGQPGGTTIQVWLEDPANLGTLSNVGSFTVGGEGEGKFERDTSEGDTLPYGVASVSSLVGLAIELRASDGTTVLFSGVVPSMVSDD